MNLPIGMSYGGRQAGNVKIKEHHKGGYCIASNGKNQCHCQTHHFHPQMTL